MIRKTAHQNIPPTKELLLLCALACVNRDAGARIRVLTQEDLDWAELLVVATDQGVGPLVCHRLEVWAGNMLPPLWREQFCEEFKRNTRRNLFLAAELCRVLAALDAAGVRATPYKGPVLAVQAYGDIALRQFADLDIVVPQTQICQAHSTLLKLGFHSAEGGFGAPHISRQIPGQYAYWSEAPARHIELHTEATLRYMPRRLDLEPMLARRETVSLAGTQVLTFSPEDALVLLSVHGSKHFWDRLGWIADIAALDRSARGIDWELGLDRARRLGAERMVLLGASLAHDLLDTPLPEKVALQVERNAATQGLRDTVRSRFLTPRPLELGVFRRFAFRVDMCSARSNGVLYALRLAITPTEADRREGPIANYFEPLHGLLRPLRLARLYGWRSQVPRLPSVTRREVPGEVARGLLAFAEVSSEDFVLDSFTGSGQLALLAARVCGAAGIGIMSDSRAVAQAKIAARAQGTSARLRFFEQVSDEQLDAADLQHLTILFLDYDALGNETVRLRVEAAISRGVRVVSMGGNIPGWAPAREASMEMDVGKVATLKLWQSIPAVCSTHTVGAKVASDCKM